MKMDFWLVTLHVLGVVTWVASLTAVLVLLQIHPTLDEAGRARLTALERRLAIFLDAGATVAIAFGLWVALRRAPTEFKHGAWLHVKLTAVVLGVLSAHGLARVRIKRFRTGDLRPLPSWVWIAFVAGVAVAAVLGANQTLLR